MAISETCHCGDVEFTLQNDPMMHFVCHCNDCQKIWNNSFFCFAFSLDDIEINGTMGKYAFCGGSGNNLNIHFCPKCATKLYVQPELIEGMIYIPCGLLKKYFEFSPKVEIFSNNKPKFMSDVLASTESFEHNGTIERIGELLENLEQR